MSASHTTLRQRTFEILEGEVADKASRFCEIFVAYCVVLNVLAIIFESVQENQEA